MYFPTTSAKVLRPSAASTPHDLPPLPSSLADIAKLGGAHDEVLLDVAYQETSSWKAHYKHGKSRKLFATVGGAELAVWSVRPILILCKLRRTGTSLRRYGLNKRVLWIEEPDAEPGHCTLVVLTTKSFVFMYSLNNLGNVATTPVYSVPSAGTGATKGQFVAGSGEALPLPPLVLTEAGYLDFSESVVSGICTTSTSLLIATVNPPALHTIHPALFSQELAQLEDEELADLEHVAYFSDLPWLIDPASPADTIAFNAAMGLYVFLTADGRAYAVKDVSTLHERKRRLSGGSEYSLTPAPEWDGQCFYGAFRSPHPVDGESTQHTPLALRRQAVQVAFNDKFSLVAIGLNSGVCLLYNVVSPSQAFVRSHQFALRQTLKSTAPHLETGSVTALCWTSDGYALAVGWQAGWSVWTVYGKLTTWAVGPHTGASEGIDPSHTFEDRFMSGVDRLFWGPDNLELFALCKPPTSPKEKAIDEQFFVIPFAKSAVTSLHTPDNTNHAFLQLDDGLLVYRGADQPDMSVINPESDVWQSIKIPAAFISNNWPIRYACISSDARLIAVAGRRGFTHYNSLSGRWKLFDNEAQEQSIRVRGGMQWYGSTLIVATEEEDEEEQSIFRLQLFARDRPLNTAYVLDEEVLPSRVVLTSLFDSSLLVYTEDSTFYHFLLTSAKNGPKLQLCGSIGFEGVVGDPRKIRGLSWMVPRAQQRFGDPTDDLNFATVIFLIEGRLVLLRPRRAVKEEVKYDLQILADHIEFYWTHLAGIGTLENSLWGWDGEQIRVWLNALTIDTPASAAQEQLEGPQRERERTSTGGALETVEESLAISLDFYPLSVLMDKGIIVGVEHETSYRRSLDFAIFRLITNTHLFIHHVLRFHLTHGQTREAVVFGSHYAHLVYFAHALEILLHAVLEDEADALPSSTSSNFGLAIQAGPPPVPEKAVLPVVVDFLDHFEEALQVVVNCARKTEITRWAYLFQFVGKPNDLFEKCMAMGNLKVAASYLLVLHNLEPLASSSADTVRLLRAAMAKADWQLCKELSRFLFSLDHTGTILSSCLGEAGALPPGFADKAGVHHPQPRRAVSLPVPTLASTANSGPTTGAGGLPSISEKSSPAPPQPPPFQRTGSTARSLHYRMSSTAGQGGLGLGTLLSRVGTPPLQNQLRRSISGSSTISDGAMTAKEVQSREADDYDPE